MCHKLAYHQLDPYQCAAFQCSIVHRNIGEEEVDPSLEITIEYAGAIRVVVFNESCRLHNLTEAQVRRNQFAMDVAVDQLDERIDMVDGGTDEASERMTMLEGRISDMEEGYQALLALGRGPGGDWGSGLSGHHSLDCNYQCSTGTADRGEGEDGCHEGDDPHVGTYTRQPHCGGGQE